MKTKKPKDLHRHAIKRIGERYGMRATEKDLRDMEAQITAGESIYLGIESLNVSKHVVKMEGRNIVVLYNKNLHAICTALPGGDDELGVLG